MVRGPHVVASKFLLQGRDFDVGNGTPLFPEHDPTKDKVAPSMKKLKNKSLDQLPLQSSYVKCSTLA